MKKKSRLEGAGGRAQSVRTAQELGRGANEKKIGFLRIFSTQIRSKFDPNSFSFMAVSLGGMLNGLGIAKWLGILAAIARCPLVGCCVPLKVCCPIGLLPLQQAAT